MAGRSPRLSLPRAGWALLFAASGCAKLVGLTGDYYVVEGEAARGGTPGAAGAGAPSAGRGSGGKGGSSFAGGGGSTSTGGGAGMPSAGGGGGATGGSGGAGPSTGGSGGSDAGTNPGGSGGASASGGTGGDGATGGSAGSGTIKPCGDGMIGGEEECDDDNEADGDGCSADCLLEDGFTCNGASPTVCRRPFPSCEGMTADECLEGGDCCASLSVSGGQFTQGPDPAQPDLFFSSTVSAFHLDKYEVTLGRFAAFVDEYDRWHAMSGNPKAGEGAHPKLGAVSGWDSAWPLPESAGALVASLQCDATFQTWGMGDTYPVNCLDWYTAFAFCIWDGGRLPTEAEWEFTGAGGDLDNAFPWGLQGITEDRGPWSSFGDDDPSLDTIDDIKEVGTHLAGQSWYHQLDMAGSMREWVLDVYAPYTSMSRTDWAALTGAPERVLRGGAWDRLTGADIRVYVRGFLAPEDRGNNTGVRCARDL